MKQQSAANSRAASPAPRAIGKQGKTSTKSGTATPLRNVLDQRTMDLSALNISSGPDDPGLPDEPPKVALAKEKLLEEVRKEMESDKTKKAVNLVIIGEFQQGVRSTDKPMAYV